MQQENTLKILWVGRMLDWKRVDILVKSFCKVSREKSMELYLYGHGPEEEKLRKASVGYPVTLHSPVPIKQVRELMQRHDVYVLASDGGEGWGAALNEAMNEGMIPVGTYEAGSSATMIRHGINGFLYHSKNAEELADILSHIWSLKQAGKDQEIRKNALQTIRDIWSPENAAIKLLEDCNSWMNQ